MLSCNVTLYLMHVPSLNMTLQLEKVFSEKGGRAVLDYLFEFSIKSGCILASSGTGVLVI